MIGVDCETEWQPIGLAPQDGTLILAANADPAAQLPVVIYKEGGSAAFGIQPHWRSSTHEPVSLAHFTHFRRLGAGPKLQEAK